MSSVPAGSRSWKCPECGKEVLLATTQLDPIACDECLAKMKRGRSSGSGNPVSDVVAGPLATWQALPETIKLMAVVAGLVIGLVIGYVAGQAMAPKTVVTSRHEPAHATESTHSSESAAKETSPKETPVAEEPEERPDPPGPGYKWVRGRTRKDGTRGPGHWAKDPFYKGDDADAKKPK